MANITRFDPLSDLVSFAPFRNFDGLGDEARPDVGQARRAPVQPDARARPDRNLDVDAVEGAQDDRRRGDRLDDHRRVDPRHSGRGPQEQGSDLHDHRQVHGCGGQCVEGQDGGRGEPRPVDSASGNLHHRMVSNLA